MARARVIFRAKPRKNRNSRSAGACQSGNCAGGFATNFIHHHQLRPVAPCGADTALRAPHGAPHSVLRTALRAPHGAPRSTRRSALRTALRAPHGAPRSARRSALRAIRTSRANRRRFTTRSQLPPRAAAFERTTAEARRSPRARRTKPQRHHRGPGDAAPPDHR